MQDIEFFKEVCRKEHYCSLNAYLRHRFGRKVYKVALDGGMTCPNRDGRIGRGGCIFCSGGGSGEFAERRLGHADVAGQIEAGAARIRNKTDADLFIAYFQSYTNTYAPVSYLRELFTQAIMHPNTAVLSIATRPDCLPDEVIGLLAELNHIKPVWVELGLQTIHEKTANDIRRGYPLEVYEDAVRRLEAAGIEVITHVILGLPGETKGDMIESVRYLAHMPRLGQTAGDEAGRMQQGVATSDCAEAEGEAGQPGQRTGASDGIAAPDVAAAAQDTEKEKEREKDKEKDKDKDKVLSPYPVRGIKLQLLHVLKGTDLAAEYGKGAFEVLSLEDYIDILFACIEELPPDMVVHRITGDGPKSLLIAPAWSADKKGVLARIRHEMKVRHLQQGSRYSMD